MVVSDALGEGVRNVVVVDNGSTDNTRSVAEENGAIVLIENERGYGAACLKGIRHISGLETPPEIVVFMDGDHADDARDLAALIQPILDDEADLVIGSRVLGQRERGSLTAQQRFGNALATQLLYWFYGQRFTDLGPFRAIRYDSLMSLGMVDRNYGWTVEMQVKAAKKGLRCVEVPVRYRRRIGQSKVSGTLKGSILAGYKILLTLFRYA